MLRGVYFLDFGVECWVWTRRENSDTTGSRAESGPSGTDKGTYRLRDGTGGVTVMSRTESPRVSNFPSSTMTVKWTLWIVSRTSSTSYLQTDQSSSGVRRSRRRTGRVLRDNPRFDRVSGTEGRGTSNIVPGGEGRSGRGDSGGWFQRQRRKCVRSVEPIRGDLGLQ